MDHMMHVCIYKITLERMSVNAYKIPECPKLVASSIDTKKSSGLVIQKILSQ